MDLFIEEEVIEVDQLRKIMEVIDVDQLKETNNGSLSWALPHSGLKLNEIKLNKSILEKKGSLKALYLRTYCDRVAIFLYYQARLFLWKWGRVPVWGGVGGWGGGVKS